MTLKSFRDRHAGATVVVCGCGPSLHELSDPQRVVTIGVNDVGRLFDPTYLVVVNPRSQFKGDRFGFVERSHAQALFTQLDLGPVQPPVVRFRLGQYGGTDIDRGDVLHYTQNSPYVAVMLAAWMGARRIGLIGVDLTEGHFFGGRERHVLAPRLAEIDAQYGRLAVALAKCGVELVNLSTTSRLVALPRVGADWLNATPAIERVVPAAPQASALRIVSYATTPVAGVPELLARCIAYATPHDAHCVWTGGNYGNGVSYAGGVDWNRQPREANALLESADVVIVHNGKIAAAHQKLLAEKSVVTMAHNYGWNVDMQHVQRGGTGLVVGQYQATLPEFAGWGVVPNPLPLWDPSHAPEVKGEVIRIAYTPSGRHERYPRNHRLYWHGKGFDTTINVLNRLARLPGVVIESTEHGQMSHAQALAVKRRSHIVIDECVTGSYHRNSLEGLAAGCVVVNGVGLLPGVEDVLRRCAPGADHVPFVFSTLATLETTLRGLIEQGPAALEAAGRANREWVQAHWDFAAQWPRFWEAACDPARGHRVGVLLPPSCRPAPPTVPCRPTVSPKQGGPMQATPTEPVSVIVPHGGAERLPHLAATLATLRQRDGVGEIVVVEMGPNPVAIDVARRWADRHLFVEHDGAFERARALNAGQAVAKGELLLWLDNDLLVPPDFVSRAAQELRARRLDALTPYSTVRYLSQADSQRVLQGVCDPQQCRPENVLAAGTGASGGATLVRREFLAKHGGLVEGFRGWGGEDNAWNHKVALLGRCGRTLRTDQHIHHLYHPGSGGNRVGCAGAAHPHYAANVELMRRVCTVRRPDEFVSKFPPVPCAPGQLTRFGETPPVGPGTVWAYWEGECPDWIRACGRTLAAAAPTLRLLSPETFNQLRDQDRDIDLSRLQVAHRADFVRLFLLKRYGGLWVDADCLMLQPLQPVLDLLQQHEMVGHRERSGLVSNGFLAARPDSRILAAVYAKVCALLRSHQALGWTSIGSEPLTAAVGGHPEGWHELPCQRVQPVCWSQPEAFFEERPATGHEQCFEPQAICYMLSNTEVRKHLARHVGADLLGPQTFFTFLLQRAVGTAGERAAASPLEAVFTRHAQLYRQYRDESVSGPGSSRQQTQELRERLPLLLAHLGIRSLLDAPCGDFNWMQHVALGLDRYVGADIMTGMIDEHLWRHRRAGRQFICVDLLGGALPQCDAIFCRDLLPHLSFAEIGAVLENFRRSGATYLITTTFTGHRQNVDTAGGQWRTIDLNSTPFGFPPPLLIVNEKCTEAGATFGDKSLGVWRLADLPWDLLRQMGRGGRNALPAQAPGLFAPTES
ncbi:glycosyltransferase [Cupriavidus necator]|uniref:glycosyltransferase n=1 Tax=Cupriavidus necator TaxID=106590 RepID=UPI0039C00747